MLPRLLVLIVGLAAMLAAHVSRADFVHIGGTSYYRTVKVTFPQQPVLQSVTKVWVFSDQLNATFSDPYLPALTVGSSGPWTAELTNENPFGDAMPFTGVLFTLQAGATPMLAVGDTGFFVPTEKLDDTAPLLTTLYWIDTGQSGFQSETGLDRELIDPYVPYPTTDPEGNYEYIWEHYVNVPEPSTLAVLGLCFLMIWSRGLLRPAARRD